jgi:hypothetical protein
VHSDRYIFIAVDVKGYSGTLAAEQVSIQRDLRELLAGAAAGARLPYDRWVDQPQGDGVLILAPPEHEPRYLDDFVDHLVMQVRRRNRDRLPEGRLHLRLGLAQGPATLAANGFAGEAPILACRLRDAAVTKAVLAESGADLVVAVSDRMFTDNVLGDLTRFSSTDFTRVEIDEEKVNVVAWLWLPRGYEFPPLLLEREHKSPAPRRAEPVQPVESGHTSSVQINYSTVRGPVGGRDVHVRD